MNMYDSSIVASGHLHVSEAAATMLEAGGNAFDAVVAAGFAANVAEPALTSLGGGGFMLAHCADSGDDIFFDFFVDTPGRGLVEQPVHPDFFGVTVNFSGSAQDFQIGLGSVAVPGTLKGLLHIHKRLGRMPLTDVLFPAKKIALGHILNEQQAHFLDLLRPIMILTERGRRIYKPEDTYVAQNDTLVNYETAAFLEQLSLEGDESFYKGEIARLVHREMHDGQGLLTATDLAQYTVKERKPLSVSYRKHTFLTAPEPSMGGSLIALSLALAEREMESGYTWGSAKHLLTMTDVMREVERLRSLGITSPSTLKRFLDDDLVIAESCRQIRLFSRGTTHISVADNHGNCASMTCSNGEGSGYFAPGTGVMLNNMMGEDDLHPGGFHSSPPGQRVFSMMSPSLLLKNGRVRLVIGSGGSKRIRTAVTQVVSQVVDCNIPLQQAVDGPRLYLDEGRLQVEPGFSPYAVDELRKNNSVNLWGCKDVYFGGVHAVIPGVEGAGDPRRGGDVAVVFSNVRNM